MEPEYYLVLLPVALLLVVSKVLMKLCEKYNLPTVIGMLVAGLLVGGIQYIPGQAVLTDASTEGIGYFAQIGVILIMFSAGLETDLKEIKKIGGPAVIITLAGVVVPMALGMLVAILLSGGFAAQTADTMTTNLFYGIILTATSVSVSVATLRELGKLNTRVGHTVVAAAILDDIVGIVVLSLALAFHDPDAPATERPWMVIVKMLLFFTAIALVAGLLSRLFRALDRKYPHHRLIPIMSIGLCFLVAYISERYFNIADITGAYIVGLILSTNPDSEYIDRKAEVLGYMIFVPIFFGNIGLSTRFGAFDLPLLLFGVLFILAGMAGKVLGCGGAALLCRYSKGDSLRVGVGMMARAEVALVTAQKGVEYGLIDTSIMPFIVLLIVVTSLTTPLLLHASYRW